MQQRFRLARVAAVDATVRLMRSYCAEDGYAFDERAARESVTRLITDPGLGWLWVVADGGDVEGYLAVTLGFSLEYGGWDAFLDELAWDAKPWRSPKPTAASTVSRRCTWKSRLIEAPRERCASGPASRSTDGV